MSPRATTVIFVPGGWHSPSCYRLVSDILKKVGYKTDYVHLPSVGFGTDLGSFQNDVDAIRTQVLKAVDAGEYVVVVVHSYGGVPTSEALEGLDINSRQAANKDGGVVRLFFCCSFVVAEGQSLLGNFGCEPPWFNVSSDRMVSTVHNPENVVYNDMVPEEVEKAVASLIPFAYKPMATPLKFAAWKVLPSTYLYCTKDNAIPYAIQKKMVEGTAKGINVDTEVIEASHSPFYSEPEMLAKAIRISAGEKLQTGY